MQLENYIKTRRKYLTRTGKFRYSEKNSIGHHKQRERSQSGRRGQAPTKTSTSKERAETLRKKVWRKSIREGRYSKNLSGVGVSRGKKVHFG